VDKCSGISANVLHVVDDFSEGGAAVVVDNLIKGLPSGEFVPYICCLDAVGRLGEIYRQMGVSVTCMNRAPGLDKRLFIAIRRCIRDNKIDIIHAHQYTAYFYSLVASFLVFPRPKIVFTEHGRHFPEIYRWKRALVNQFLHYFTHSFVAVSEAVKASLVTYEKFPAGKIGIIVNGIDNTAFAVRKDNALARELGLHEDSIVFGTMSRLVEAKNHQALLRAFPGVLRQFPNARLVIVGDGEYRQDLEDMTHSLGIEDEVLFTGVRHNIKELLSVFDVLALVSFYEGTSMSILEAMAAAVPVLASDVSGNTFLVEDGVNGFLVPVDDDEFIVERMLELCKDRKLRTKMGAAGSRVVAERFSRGSMALKYAAIYRELLGKSAVS